MRVALSGKTSRLFISLKIVQILILSSTQTRLVQCVLKTYLWNLNIRQLKHWCYSTANHFVSESSLIPCYDWKGIFLWMGKYFFQFLSSFEHWAEISFTMQLRVEFLKKLHFGFKQFVFPQGRVTWTVVQEKT